MEWVETTGRTVDEAKRSALEQLGVGESDAEFEVVAEPRMGLFGRLKEEARVRARLQPRYPRSKGERRDRRRAKAPGPGPSGSGPSSGSGHSSAGPASARSIPRDLEAVGAAEPLKPAREEAAPPHRSPAHHRRRGRRSGAATNPADPDGASVVHVSAEDQARLAEEFLRGLLDKLGTSASVSSEVLEEGLIDLNVTGEDLGILIGPRGTTLLALQELTRTVVQRKVPAAESRLVVDVNGYRKRRHEALARFARQVANEVSANQLKRALEPMPPADRKVVHDAVTAIPGVTTVSEGEEPNRRVVLVPEPQEETATSQQPEKTPAGTGNPEEPTEKVPS